MSVVPSRFPFEGRSAPRRALVSLSVVVVAIVTLLAAAPAHAGGTAHRVAVVVDLGDEVRTARVTFEGETITGLEALRLAGFDPVARAYGGQGGAVCSVCGRGCSADSTCLTCGGANYWAYFRAVAGASSYTYSSVGAGSTQVHDGDVEAWKWGPGVAPEFISFAEVWGETTTTAAPATTVPPATRPSSTDPPTSAGTAPTDAGNVGGTATTSATRGGQGGTSSAPGGGIGAAGATGGGSAAGAVDAGATSGAAGAGAGGAEGDRAGAGAPGHGDHGHGASGRSSVSGLAAGAGSGGVDSAGDRGGADAWQAAGDGVAAGPVAPRADTGSSSGVAGAVGFAAVVAGLALWISRARLARRRTSLT